MTIYRYDNDHDDFPVILYNLMSISYLVTGRLECTIEVGFWLGCMFFRPFPWTNSTVTDEQTEHGRISRLEMYVRLPTFFECPDICCRFWTFLPYLPVGYRGKMDAWELEHWHPRSLAPPHHDSMLQRRIFSYMLHVPQGGKARTYYVVMYVTSF